MTVWTADGEDATSSNYWSCDQETLLGGKHVFQSTRPEPKAIHGLEFASISKQVSPQAASPMCTPANICAISWHSDLAVVDVLGRHLIIYPGRGK